MVTSSPPTGLSPSSSASCLPTHSFRSRRLTSSELQSSAVFSSRDLGRKYFQSRSKYFSLLVSVLCFANEI